MSTFCAKIGEFSYFLWNSSKSPPFWINPTDPHPQKSVPPFGPKIPQNGKIPPFWPHWFDALMGRRRAPLLVAEGPIRGHTKICTIRRPSSDVDFLRRQLVDGSRQPGILELLRFLVLDKFLEALRTGQNFPRTIIFFRCLILHFSCCCRGLENLIFHRSWIERNSDPSRLN